MRTNETHAGLYRLMTLTRTLDRVIGAHDGHWHGLEGEEATIAGVYYGLRPGDVVAPHYRGMVSAALAKGADLRTILAGCLGRRTAYHGGRHRSDICGPPEFGTIGLYAGSLGPPLGYALGGALAAQLDRRDDVAVGVFGDGTSSRGDCHEAMNMAAVMSLPMIFVCQNNQIAISTEVGAAVGGSVAARGPAVGMPGVTVDGNDVVAVRDAMDEALARARRGDGPSLIECATYRVAGHFYSDAEDYRDADEIAAWRDRDPITRYRQYLVREEVMEEADLDAIDADVTAEVDTAFKAAEADPLPEADDLAPTAAFAETAA
ncbi:MAG: thiamine pyrophosphate-dependent dehydrogenase E1 component subunit alpha [Pseudomonadota bacterium]